MERWCKSPAIFTRPFGPLASEPLWYGQMRYASTKGYRWAKSTSQHGIFQGHKCSGVAQSLWTWRRPRHIRGCESAVEGCGIILAPGGQFGHFDDETGYFHWNLKKKTKFRISCSKSGRWSGRRWKIPPREVLQTTVVLAYFGRTKSLPRGWCN